MAETEPLSFFVKLDGPSGPMWVGKKPLQGSQDFTLPDTNSHLIPQNVKTQDLSRSRSQPVKEKSFQPPFLYFKWALCQMVQMSAHVCNVNLEKCRYLHKCR